MEQVVKCSDARDHGATRRNAMCAGFGGGLDVRSILEFVDSGRNLILAGSSQASETLRTLAAEVGVDIDDKGTSVYDHFSHAVGANGQPDHTLVVAKDLVASPAIFGALPKVCGARVGVLENGGKGWESGHLPAATTLVCLRGLVRACVQGALLFQGVALSVPPDSELVSGRRGILGGQDVGR